MEMRSRSPLYTSSTSMHMGRHDLASLHPVRCSRGAGTGRATPRSWEQCTATTYPVVRQTKTRIQRSGRSPSPIPLPPCSFSRWAAQHANVTVSVRRASRALS